MRWKIAFFQCAARTQKIRYLPLTNAATHESSCVRGPDKVPSPSAHCHLAESVRGNAVVEGLHVPGNSEGSPPSLPMRTEAKVALALKERARCPDEPVCATETQGRMARVSGPGSGLTAVLCARLMSHEWT